MEKVVVWYTVNDCGDGSVEVRWHLTKKRAEDAEKAEENSGYNFAESTIGSVETYVGSNIHKWAIEDANRTER